MISELRVKLIREVSKLCEEIRNGMFDVINCQPSNELITEKKTKQRKLPGHAGKSTLYLVTYPGSAQFTVNYTASKYVPSYLNGSTYFAANDTANTQIRRTRQTHLPNSLSHKQKRYRNYSPEVSTIFGAIRTHKYRVKDVSYKEKCFTILSKSYLDVHAMGSEEPAESVRSVWTLLKCCGRTRNLRGLSVVSTDESLRCRRQQWFRSGGDSALRPPMAPLQSLSR